MVDSEYSMAIYKSIKINIGNAIKNPEILKLFRIILKLKKRTRMQLKNCNF